MLRGAAPLLDRKAAEPASPPPGRRVRAGGDGKGRGKLVGEAAGLGGAEGRAPGPASVGRVTGALHAALCSRAWAVGFGRPAPRHTATNCAAPSKGLSAAC